jgi:hypothetical protein
MKAVEVAVHEALGRPENLRGVDLMRKAFNVEDGKLTDMNAEKGEREACGKVSFHLAFTCEFSSIAILKMNGVLR